MNVVSNWIKQAFSDRQVVLLMSALVLGLIAVYFFADMLAPAIAAVVIAFLLDGPVAWLERRGLKHIYAVIVTFVGFMCISVVVVVTVLPLLFNQVLQFVNATPQMVGAVQHYLVDLAAKFPDLFNETQVNGWFTDLGSEVAVMGRDLLQYSVSGVRGAMTTAVYMVLVPVMVFFFLKDKVMIGTWFKHFLPMERGLLTQVWREAVSRSGDYARGKVYEIMIVGGASYLIYYSLGINFATLLAVATGLSVLIPYIGAAIVTLPVALVAYAQWGFGSEMFGAVLAYLILQALDGNLLAPLLFSEVVKLHPNAIIIAILVFGGIWGLWGVFFAIPLATAANAVIRAWQEHRDDNRLISMDDP